MELPPPVYYRDGELYLENHRLSKVARDHGTPTYAYSFARVKKKLAALRSAFTMPLHVHYAMKANSNRQLLKKLRKEDVGVDVVSGGEIRRALECGFRGRDIVFSGIAKSVDEINLSLRHGVHVFNVESPQELERIGGLAQRAGKIARVSFRLNPNVNPKTHPYITTGYRENKFGMDKSFLPLLLKILRKNHGSLMLVGLDFHIGSQLMDVRPFEAAVKSAVPIFRDLKKQGHPLKYFDVGGGLGISYDGKKSVDLRKYGRGIETQIKDLGAELLCEPGRFLVGDAGVLLTTVEYVKKTPYKNFVIVDTGMHHLIRPALYQSFHRILPLRKASGAVVKSDVVGPICESSDFLAQDRKMAKVAPGQVLAVCDAGAYGFVMSSDYNLHSKPGEILL